MLKAASATAKLGIISPSLALLRALPACAPAAARVRMRARVCVDQTLVPCKALGSVDSTCTQVVRPNIISIEVQLSYRLNTNW
eukprot:COSAG02_NODE_1246_length_13659_cov_23.906858_8_plen_83_part_00